eukprot:TRINITY_DN3647_c0_g1_i1.p1 TRINITY_DN3647_c0_g1~~TRINITY_DN3647_c0_g1_i1.p1  ORF type:complete len:344 (+),score=115.73 TRINITY_DN3647_c0_g1_i1:99-1034(+)
MADEVKIEINPAQTRIGWIGTGVMGRWMCSHLMNAGYRAFVYNRSAAKAQPLVDQGATLCATPADVAANSDVVFTMVGYPSDVRNVILGADGVLSTARAGSIIVDMTTSEPSLACEIYEKAKEKGVASIDAPVSGGDIGARNATLSIMVGGERQVADTVQPLFQVLGKNINYLGAAGSGQHTKMVNQILIATNMIGVVEGLLYGYKAGLDLNTVIAAVGSGAAGSWSINNLGPRIINRNFDPGFFVEHFVKDMGIALQEAKRMNLSLPGLSLAHQFYVAAIAQGHGRMGTHSLALVLESLNNVQMQKPSNQ